METTCRTEAGTKLVSNKQYINRRGEEKMEGHKVKDDYGQPNNNTYIKYQ